MGDFWYALSVGVGSVFLCFYFLVFFMKETISGGAEAGNGEGKVNVGVIGVVAVGVLLAVGAVFLMRGSGEEKAAVSETSGRETSSEVMPSAGEEMSLRTLLGMGKSQQCVFKSEGDGVKSEGTFYISGGKSRAMISNTVFGKETERMTSNMIFDTASNTMYLWDEATKEGMRMTMNLDQVSKNGEVEGDSDSSDPGDFARELDQNYSYDCDSWKVNESFFTVPPDVSFAAMPEMMNGGSAPATLPGMNQSEESAPGLSAVSEDTVKAMSCAACEQVGDQQEECRKALGC